MYFQKVLKGISGLDKAQAQEIIDVGLFSNWWRKAGKIYPQQVRELLTEENLMYHLSDYSKPLPSGHPLEKLGSTYGEVSPFISTTAGTVEVRDGYNLLKDPHLTAMRFATRNFRDKGIIIHCYLMVIGKMSIEHQHFAEDVRDLHIYQEYLKFRNQGEVVGKVFIPSIQIEKIELYDGRSVKSELKSGLDPKPLDTIMNPSYLPPEDFSNVREVMV